MPTAIFKHSFFKEDRDRSFECSINPCRCISLSHILPQQPNLLKQNEHNYTIHILQAPKSEITQKSVFSVSIKRNPIKEYQNVRPEGWGSLNN